MQKIEKTYLISKAQKILDEYGSKKYKLVKANTTELRSKINLYFEQDNKIHKYIIKSFYSSKKINKCLEEHEEKSDKLLFDIVYNFKIIGAHALIFEAIKE